MASTTGDARGARRQRRDAARDLEPEVITDPERAREIALGILTRAFRSSRQLHDALVRKGVEPTLAGEIIARYEEVGLLDDATLASTIARTRHSERGQSRRAIQAELSRKGFAQEDIGQALHQIDDDDERGRAHDLAAARWARLGDLPEQTKVRRVVAMLGRKGYAPSLAFGVVKDLARADSDIGE